MGSFIVSHLPCLYKLSKSVLQVLDFAEKIRGKFIERTIKRSYRVQNLHH